MAPTVKTTLHAVYTEEDIKALIIADLALRGHPGITISNIWPTGCGPNDPEIGLPEGGSIKIVDEYTVELVTHDADLKKAPIYRGSGGGGPGLESARILGSGGGTLESD
jgi:hypothetical protein